MTKKYIVRLSSNEQTALKELINKGKLAAYKRKHAQILLKADISSEGDAWNDAQISEAFDVSISTIERVRQRLVEEGLEVALNRTKPTQIKNKTLDGEQEAHLVALTGGEPPEGRARWTLRLLADKMVKLEYVDNISHETVRQVLKKNKIKPWQKKEWCIPPEANAEFVCHMEEVLDVYQKPNDPAHPLICMDETSKQHIKEVRQPISVKPTEPERYDFEYERNGVSNLLIFFDPLTGWRHVEVTDKRTAIDWAHQIRDWVDIYYPHASRITWVFEVKVFAVAKTLTSNG